MRLTIVPNFQKLAIVFVCLSLLMAFSQKPPSARAAGSFVVNTSNDIFSTNGLLSLREALAVANGTFTGPFDTGEQAQLGGCTFNGSGFVTGGCGAGIFDTITFDSSVTEITPGGGYATLIDNGTWLAGAAGVPRINAINLTDDVFKIAASDVTISNLSIVNGALGYADIRVQSGKDTRLAYNYLGTIPAATNCSPTGVTKNATTGIIIESNNSGAAGANNGVAYIYGNSIGCHQYGVYVAGADYVYIGVQPDSTTIDGNYIGINSSQANLGHTADGIVLDAILADGVRFAQIYGNTISKNLGHGVISEGSGSNANTSNYQNVIRGNIISVNGLDGIHLEAGTNGSFIGGLIIEHVNTITLNHQNGIMLLNSNSNLIQGNLIGASAAGNALSGIYLDTSDSNIITVNNIQSNGNSGVWLYDSDSNFLTFNSIGTDFTISSAAPNAWDGVTISTGSASNTIGGIFPAERNFISGNTLCGVRLRNNADNNTVAGNFIGLNYTGDAAIPNNAGGICIQNGSDNNSIGLISPAEKQYISGNAGPGVLIDSSDFNAVFSTNYIGVAVDNVSPMGNGGEGILINGGSSNLIGPGLVAFNHKAGVALIGSALAEVTPFFVGYNGGLPIDLGNDGFTPNDPGDADAGPNDLLNYPVITSASGSPLNLQGTTCANCYVYFYGTGGNPAMPGGSASLVFSVLADALGNWNYTLPAGYDRHQVTVMTYQINRTSEFSPTPVLYLPLISKP